MENTNINADASASSNPISLIGMLFMLIILNPLVILNDFYSSFRQVSKSFLNILLYIWRVWSDRKKHCVDRNVNQTLPMEKPAEMEALCNEDLKCEEEELSIGEVIMVMGQLGTCYDPDGDKLQDSMSSDQITALFEEQEPSLQEVKEAFCIFDQNNDGFIDANELKTVISTLCLTEATESDCIRMIRAYDDNGDGAIDFNEFLTVMTNSFS